LETKSKKQIIRFAFALTPRMQAFIELRNGLNCLETARQRNDAYSWLQAISDVRASLLGAVGRKAAMPELMGLLKSMRRYLLDLAEKHPSFHDKIIQTCDTMLEYEQTLTKSMPEVLGFLADDGLLQAWSNATQKQDWLGHKLNLPQALPILWKSLEIQHILSQKMQDLCSIVLHIDAMLNDFVPWVEKTAQGGLDQTGPIRSEQGEEFGLLIVGLEASWVERGIIPEFSGNRLAIRLRFQQWQCGTAQNMINDDVPYRMMLVPVS